MKSLLLLLGICLSLFSCSKNDSGNQLIWQYDNGEMADSAKIATQLVGSWRLVQQRFYPEFDVVMAYKNVKVKEE